MVRMIGHVVGHAASGWGDGSRGLDLSPRVGYARLATPGEFSKLPSEPERHGPAMMCGDGDLIEPTQPNGGCDERDGLTSGCAVSDPALTWERRALS